MELDCRGAASEQENTREYYQARTRYWIREARRALANAHHDLILRDRRGYVDWMGNATWLLCQAAAWREEARRLTWGHTERKPSMVDSDTATVERDATNSGDVLFDETINTPILYHRVPDATLFRTLLRMRSIVWERHFKNTHILLGRHDPEFTEEAHTKRAKEFKDEKHPNFNKLLNKGKITFGMQFDNEFLLSLCNGEEEQKSFQKDIDALVFYQERINKFRIRDTIHEARHTCIVKVNCKQCNRKIDRIALERELRRIDVSETAARATKNSVFCSYHCMLENLALKA
jgi:hypothetical protein